MAMEANIPYSKYIKIQSPQIPTAVVQRVVNVAKTLNISLDDLISKGLKKFGGRLC